MNVHTRPRFARDERYAVRECVWCGGPLTRFNADSSTVRLAFCSEECRRQGSSWLMKNRDGGMRHGAAA